MREIRVEGVKPSHRRQTIINVLFLLLVGVGAILTRNLPWWGELLLAVAGIAGVLDLWRTRRK
jgi:hypothetical protein